MTFINLLPWREQARQAKKNRFFLTLAVAMGITLLFSLFYHVYFSSMITHQEYANHLLETKLLEEKAKLQTFMLKQKNQALLLNNLHFIFSLREKSYLAVRLLDELARIVPDSIMLTDIKQEKNLILITGKAESNLQVAIFLEKIAKSPFFQKPVLTEISGNLENGGEERNFKLAFQQSSENNG